MKKIIISMLAAILLCSAIVPSVFGVNEIKQTCPLSLGTILYVGGSGPGNYTTIQDAINDASDGDTIYVYSGTYFTGAEIYLSEKSNIKLIGENKETTIIKDKLTLRNAPDIYIGEFTFNDEVLLDFGTDGTEFNNNIIKGEETELIRAGIFIDGDNCVVSNNEISFCTIGIRIETITSTINSNSIDSCYSGINGYMYDEDTDDEIINLIENNIISNCEDKGIQLFDGNNVLITHNTVINNKFGIFISNVHSIHISENNIYDNTIDAYFMNSIFNLDFRPFSNRIIWSGNYWGKPVPVKLIPGVSFGILGTIILSINNLLGLNLWMLGYLLPSKFNLDISPAQELNEI